MPERIPQSVTSRIPLYLVLSSDHVSPATGKTLAVTISKNGAAFGNPSGGATNATEIANGWYYFDASTTDTGTLGPLIILGTATSCDPCTIAYNVAVDAVNVIQWNGTAVSSPATAGIPDVNVKNYNNHTAVTDANNLPEVDVEDIKGTASAATAGYVGPDWGHVNAPTTTVGLTGTTIATSQVIASVSGAVGSVTGAVGSVTGNVGGNVTGSVGSVVGAVGSVTGNVGGDVLGHAGVDWSRISNQTATVALTNTTINPSSSPTVAQIATAVWQDTTAGDFTVSGSIGKSLFTAGVVPGGSGGLFIAGSNAATTVNFTGNLSGSVGSVTGLTTATITTAIWSEPVPGAYTIGEAGYVLGNGSSSPTPAAIAAAVWQDVTGGDFSVVGSIGYSLFTGVPPGQQNGLFIAGNNYPTNVTITGKFMGSVQSVVDPVTVVQSRQMPGASRWSAPT